MFFFCSNDIQNDAGITMAWYLNYYVCERCHTQWEDEWSCGCDDECPNCGAGDMEAQKSDDLSVIVDEPRPGQFVVYYSPADAEHSPNYKVFAKFADRRQAILWAEVARHSVLPPAG